MKRLLFFSLILLLIGIVSCGKGDIITSKTANVISEGIGGYDEATEGGEDLDVDITLPETDHGDDIVLCDFESVDLEFRAVTYSASVTTPMQYSVVDNPVAGAGNNSARVGKVITGNAQWEHLNSKILDKKFVYSEDGTRFTMKVYAPKAGASVCFKMKSSTAGVPEKEITSVKSGEAGKWVTLEFDIATLNLPDNVYDQIIVLFDAGVNNAPDQTWYFDDIIQTKSTEVVTPPEVPEGMEMFCNFESVSLQFSVYPGDTPGTMTYAETANPDKSGINTSDHVGCVTSGGQKWELLYCTNPMTKPMVFSRNAVFTMKVRSPKAGGKVYFKLEGKAAGVPEKEIANVTVPNANVWTLLTYDFSSFNLPDGKYDGIVLLFDAGETGSGQKWYFDDIIGPARN